MGRSYKPCLPTTAGSLSTDNQTGEGTRTLEMLQPSVGVMDAHLMTRGR